MPDRPAPGTPITVRWRKWDGAPHWEHDSVYLGADAWGDWVGQRVGWRSARPGRDLTARGRNVTLFPASGDWAFTRNEPPASTRTYIDLAWDAGFDGTTFVGVDMDLDVVDQGAGVFIDDEDEWAEHRVHYGYPLDIVERLERTAVELEKRVRAADPPFDDAVPDAWLARLDELTADGPWPAPPAADAPGAASATTPETDR